MVAAASNLSGCKDSAASLDKKLTQIQADLEALGASTSEIGRLRAGLEVADGKKLDPEVQKATSRRVNELTASTNLRKEIKEVSDLKNEVEQSIPPEARASVQPVFDHFSTILSQKPEEVDVKALRKVKQALLKAKKELAKH